MKRTITILGGTAAVVLIALFAWMFLANGGREAGAPESDNVPTVDSDQADSTDRDTEESGSAAGVADVGDTGEGLVLLPRIEGNPRVESANGLGGGGGVAPAAAQSESLAIASTMPVMDFSEVLADVTFVLNGSLPAEPTTGIVQQRVFPQEPLDLAGAQRIAEQYGFTGPLYVEVIQWLPLVELASEGESAADEGGISVARPPHDEVTSFIPATIYRAFDGRRTLTIFPEGVSYTHNGFEIDYGEDVANALPIAEAFLSERGLLDFPYLLVQGYSNSDVEVYRLVDGKRLNEPEMYVQVAPGGEVLFAGNHQQFSTIETLGNYPLITAQAAWELILEDAVANNLSFEFLPQFEVVQVEISPPFERPQFWTRELQLGDEVHLYAWPIAYKRADGAGPPRIEINQFVLSGLDEDLQATAAATGQPIHVWGQITEDGVNFELQGWEALSDPNPYPQDGEVVIENGQVLLVGEDGMTHMIPDAPADLQEGMRVNLFAWASRDVGLDYPLLDWEWMEEYHEVTAEPIVEVPMVIEENFVDPFQLSVVTIDQASLAYMQVVDYAGLEKVSRPPVYLQPVWEFSGVTDLGDKIMLRVQAVSPDYLQAPQSS